MFDYTKTEIATGVFLVFGLVALGYLSISIGGLRLLHRQAYDVRARFSNVGDLKVRAPVKIAGVTVGQVESIRLSNYFGEVGLAVNRSVALPKDTIASISTAGLLGEAFVSLSPGAADAQLHEGDLITHTEPALNVADLLGRYAFGGQSQADGGAESSGGQGRARAPAAPAAGPRKTAPQ
jgi:phospholipid/cholesterol/gamma-HCH transport system substrate-binding protein